LISPKIISTLIHRKSFRIAIGLGKPATVAVVDAIAHKVIIYRSIRQLLGENYKLLNRQRQAKRSSSHECQNAQIRGAFNQFGESQLGEYIDRLLAREVVAIAQKYQAGSIVLPKVGDIREIVQSEIQADSQQKCPEFLEGQQKYAKPYRVSVHQWSYARLIDCIQTQAKKLLALRSNSGSSQFEVVPRTRRKSWRSQPITYSNRQGG
jgi:transposase